MTKKIFFIFILFLFIHSSYIFGQINENTGEQLITTELNLNNIIEENNKPLNSLAKVLFCGNKGGITETIKIGEEKEICLEFINDSDQEISFTTEFVGGQTTNDQFKSKSCKLNDDLNDDFPRLIKNIDRENPVILKPNSKTIKKSSIKFPITKQGVQNGCFAYSIDGTESKASDLITLRFRNAYFMDFLVVGGGDIKSLININKIENELNGNKINIMASLKNNGVFDETVNINGKISNSFGFSKNFSQPDLKISLNDTLNFNTKDLGETFELPRYKGPFKVEIEINHKPYFDFDISNSGIDPKILEGGTITETKSIFIFPTLPLIGLLVFILLIYLAFFKKAKVIIVQQGPNQPQQ
ncbi:hypothetical protein K9M48_01770 [Candidatus Gracilibacteria bacterium]|nr:hypothetical protein [Candidatus Gracilibacteria bacterium]